MVIDFSNLDLKERPQFVLQNLDETNIGYLGAILSPTAKICYNEISEISFEYPSQVNGVVCPEYDLLTSMRVVDVLGYGRFLLKNPQEKDDGIVKKKQCTAYSLEIELGNKTITLPEGLYKLYDPLGSGTSDKVLMDIILMKFPSWKLGEVDPALWDVYRYFSVDGVTGYNFMKTDLQEKYSCIFDFDTYTRTINIRSVNSAVDTKPVYLSKTNLLKEIKVDEDTESLVTALEVYGADGVDIRNVNPLGTNTIYNLDHFMTSEFFSEDIITKWSDWKANLENSEDTFFLLTMKRLGRISERSTADAELTDLEGELSSLESQKAVLIQSINKTDPNLLVPIEGTSPQEYEKEIDILKRELQSTNNKIEQKKRDIGNKKDEIEFIQETIDTITGDLEDIVSDNGMDKYFTPAELEMLDRYFKGGTLTDETFVLSDVQSYGSADETARSVYAHFSVTSNKPFDHAEYTDDLEFWNTRGGEITVEYRESSTSQELIGSISGSIVRATIEKHANDNKIIISGYIANGTICGSEFESATITITGNLNVASIGQTSFTGDTSDSSITVTRSNTFYQKYSVQQELYEYGKENLVKLSSPTYFFSVDSVNFFTLSDFEDFAKKFKLGDKLYLHLDDRVLQPIATSIDIEFDDPSKLRLMFGDSFQLNDATFKLESLLDKSVAMGSALSVNQYKYSDFVTSGADNTVENFITSAIDAMRNNILSGTNNEVTIDGAGIRLRRWDSNGYDPKQVWINNNALMFTSSNWSEADGATVGIGEFYDKNFGSMYGVVAPAVVGTLLAGNQLIIESTKTDGNVLGFRVDSDGAKLHNASFNLYDAAGGTGNRINLDPMFGIIGGSQSNMFHYNPSTGLVDGVNTEANDVITSLNELTSGDKPKVNFWMDMAGNVWLRGHIEATSGFFSGSLEIGGPTGFRVDSQGNLSIGGTAQTPNFYISADGNMTANSGTFKGTLEGATLKGELEADPTGGIIRGVALSIGGTEQNPNFYVDSSGDLTAKGSIDLSNGSLTLGDGAITWRNLSQTGVQDVITDAANTAEAAYDGDAGSAAYKVARGTYTGAGTTFINGKYIYSPEISGGTITGGVVAGAEFTNLAKGAYIEIGPSTGDGNYGDLYLYGRNPSVSAKWEVFRVQDNVGITSIFFGGAEVLSGYNSGTSANPIANAAPQGTWDFSHATVTGLTSTAVFG